jgi:transcriptional activator SPT8
VRVYDLWASVNGGQVMTAQQRAVVGLGEGVNKAGVGRGWWAVDTPATALEVPNGTANGQAPTRKQEPVFSLACQGDGLWTLAGTQSGQINLYSLRHQPGHLIHSLTGHSSVVSALQLLPDETSLLSGSWDGTVRVSTWMVQSRTRGAQLNSLCTVELVSQS